MHSARLYCLWHLPRSYSIKLFSWFKKKCKELLWSHSVLFFLSLILSWMMTSWFSSSSALDEVHGDLSPFQWFVASPAWLQAGAAWLYSLLLFGQGLLLKLCYPCTFWLHKRPRQRSALAKWSQLLLWLLFQLHSILQKNITHMI